MANPIPDPGNPPVTVVTAAAVLLELEDRSGTMQTQEPITTTPPSQRRRNGLIAAAAAFLVVLIAGVAIVLASATGDETTPITEPPTTVTTVAPTTTVAAAVPTREEAVAGWAAVTNDGDLDAALAWLADDVECFVPGGPTCDDFLGYLIAIDAEIVFTECTVFTEPHLQCDGYTKSAIHDALGITVEPPAERLDGAFPIASGIVFTVEDGKIIRLAFNALFTGDPLLDDRFFTYLKGISPPYVNDGFVMVSPEMVPQLLEDARAFAAQDGS